MPCFVKNPHAASFKIPSTPDMWINLQLDYEFIRPDREKDEAICNGRQPFEA